jgi:hypothetical protein
VWLTSANCVIGASSILRPGTDIMRKNFRVSLNNLTSYHRFSDEIRVRRVRETPPKKRVCTQLTPSRGYLIRREMSEDPPRSTCGLGRKAAFLRYCGRRKGSEVKQERQASLAYDFKRGSWPIGTRFSIQTGFIFSARPYEI